MPPFHRRFTWSTCSTFASPFTSNRARSPNTSDIELTRAIIRTTGGGDGTSSTHALHTCGNTYDHREDTKHKRTETQYLRARFVRGAYARGLLWVEVTLTGFLSAFFLFSRASRHAFTRSGSDASSVFWT